MRDGRRVVAILPALDEAGSLGDVLARMPAWVDRVVVADNGSCDGTPEIARAAGASVVHAARRGYGAACWAGAVCVAGTLDAGDVVLFLDADGSDDPREASRLVDPVLRGEADLVTGMRVDRARMLPHQRLGTEFVAALIRLGFGHPTRDLGPFRAIRWDALRRLDMRDRAYGWTAEMQARALRQGLRVVEVPVSWSRGKGPSKVSGTLRGTLRAGRDLTRHVIGQAVAYRLEALALRKADRVRRPHGGRGGIGTPASPRT